MTEMFPAFIGQMPPAPETNRRYWTMYCRVCGIEERLAYGPDDPALIDHTNAHNARFHAAESTGQPANHEIRSAPASPTREELNNADR